jgi:hypothetical protein
LHVDFEERVYFEGTQRFWNYTFPHKIAVNQSALLKGVNMLTINTSTLNAALSDKAETFKQGSEYYIGDT